MNAPDANGWIEWSGGERPVPAKTPVYYQLRNEERMEVGAQLASRLRWQHDGDPYDIIAYRVVTK